jgi:O-antigen/teichoic acid export membrane protein
MNSIQKIAKNVGILFTSQIVSYIFTFFVVIYTARYLGAENFGILSLALSISAIVGVSADLGFNSLIVREVARNKKLESKYVINVLLIKILLLFLTYGITAIMVTVLNYSALVKTVIYVITLYVVINSFYGVFNSVFQAHEKMEYIAVGTVLSGLILFVGTFIGLYLHYNLLYFAVIYVVSSSLVFIYIFLAYLRKFSLPKLSDLDWEFSYLNFKEALYFGITAFLVAIYFYVSSILLSILDGNYAVGIFNASWRLISVFLFIPNAVILALFPVMSRHFQSSKELLEFEYNKIFKYLSVISIFIMIYGFIFAKEIIGICYGAGYSDSVVTLQVVIFAVPVIFITTLFGNLLGSVNQQRFVTIVAAINAVANILLNILLISQLSYIGAALVTIFTESIGFLLMFYYISKYIFKISIVSSLKKIIFIGIFTALVMYVLKLQINWLFSAAVGFLLFGILLLKLKVISSGDIKMFKEIL